ncbi:hypothetical protein [Mycobacteroides chelonae]|uniref:hypothetical protein n=1 Tax=Mycobacteroides chelonae TaxID=1774 RepID=UPI000994055A|nr:hypothetical protein [Mycobacteroides chelonae]
MSIQPDIQKPANDPYGLVGAHWVIESENAYRMAEEVASDAATSASRHAQSAADAESKMVDEKGKTAQSVSGGYSSSAGKLREQAVNYNTISAWMSDASGKVLGAKKHIISLVMAGTQEIRDALNSELTGTPVTPSSTALTDKYRNDIAAVATKLTIDLDAIGHSLAGDPGSSTTPTYVRAAESPKTPTVEQAAVHHALTGEGTHVEPHQLPEMPRATSLSTTESPSGASAPATSAAPHAVNPTLANLVGGGGQSTAPSASAKSSSTTSGSASPSATPSGIPAGQAHQSNEQHQAAKSPVLPRVPSIGLPNIPIAAATDIATAVSSSVSGQQLPTSTAPATPGSSLPASTGITPGTSGTPPVTPAPPVGLSPIGGGLPTPPVVQTPPVAQASPASPTAAPAPSPAQSPPPAAPRGPVVDAAWIQKSYGLSPYLELPRPETTTVPALFIAGIPEDEAHLHRALATLRHAFDDAGWSQPLAVARIRRGLETQLVYVTADGLSIHPSGVLLPHGVTPLDEIPGTPATSELSGSLMVSEKLTALIPREWTVEHVLSTVPAEENSQTIEQYQTLVGAEELLPCKLARGRDDVDVDEAMAVFARAALGSRGCGELDVESARIRAGRWVGTQPTGYLDALARWYLSDAAEAMSRGSWGEAVYSAEKYMSIRSAENKAA